MAITRVKAHKRNGKLVKAYNRNIKRGRQGKIVARNVRPSKVLVDTKTGRFFGRQRISRK